jgi:hypothetical protein
MSNDKKEKKWITSKEAKAILKISDCKLMHLRIAGLLPFLKVGNAFLYSLKNYVK